MIRSDKPCLVDAVEIGEININFIGPKESSIPGASMHAKYALTIYEAGIRVGAGNRNLWSEETNERLRQLITSMEKDICVDVFGEAPERVPSIVEMDPDDVPGL